MLYKEIVKKVSVPADSKIKQKNYSEKGTIPVIDQGIKVIGGYTDDESKIIKCDLPVIVFGDHTRCVKYINFPFCAGADGIKVLQAQNICSTNFLYYLTFYIASKIKNHGYARHYQYVEKEQVSLPPLDEQARIVVRIEELFSELDNGVQTLQTIKQQLVVYRQAVLKEAFEGKLTGSTNAQSDNLEQHIEKPRYGTSKKCDYVKSDDSMAVYRIPNIQHTMGRISHSDIKYASFTQNELGGINLQVGDILIIRSNGSASLVGRAAMIYESDIDGTFAGYLMRLRITSGKLLPKYLLLFLQSHQARIYIENKAKSTSGVHNINSVEISKLTIPVFAINDQEKIIAAIESRLSVCDSIEKTVDTALAQAEAMRQSILKKAFEGGLA